MTFLDALEQMLETQAQGGVKHEHVRKIEMFSASIPLQCGSEHFLRFNDNFTLGFDHDELIRFRDEISLGVANTLAGICIDDQKADDKPDENMDIGVCLTCRERVTNASGFPTVVGPMHFECRPEAH